MRIAHKDVKNTTRFLVILLLAVCSGSILFLPVFTGQATADAVPTRFFMGEKTCRQCHHKGEAGGQFNVWRLSAHATAHATLAMEQSILISRLSGIGEEVFDTPVCLGCHATASDTEPWQRDASFHIEDGIQCEFCHGPGSEYADEKIMKDPEAAKKAGLMKPDESVCMTCHEHKGSHKATMENQVVRFEHPVKGQVYFSFEKEFKKIAHPIKKGEVSSQGAQPDDIEKYTGAFACKSCHSGKKKGYVYSKWRLSKHARAYAELGTPAAISVARDKGVTGDPQLSSECLDCHVTRGFYPAAGDPGGSGGLDPAQGVSCEGCHGPGKQYADESGHHEKMKRPNEQTCRTCHNGYHGKSFDPETHMAAINHGVMHPEKPVPAKINEEHIRYKTPFNLAASRDGKRLYVACEASDSLIVVDLGTRKVISEVPVMRLPHGVFLSPDESRAFISNRGSDTVSEIDTQTLRVVRTIDVGDEPHDLGTNSEGTILYVANTGSHDISVVDLEKGREIKRLSGGRGTWGLDISPDNSRIYVTNNLSHFVPFRTTSQSEVSVIDTSDHTIKNRIMVKDANLIQGIDFAPDGEFAMVTLLRTKNLVPIVRVVQGWMITNGFGILWKDGTVDQLLIDGVDDHFADPTDVVITPDSRYAFVSGGGVNEVAVLDINKIKAVLKNSDPEKRKELLPNHLGISEEYVVKRIAVGHGPRGLAVSADGRSVYVADALSDAVSVIDTHTLERTHVIDLGGPDVITQVRKGERIFHSANVTWGRQYSCHSCHPDGGIDGLAYDIAPDGLGVNPVDNRTLRGILDTAPFKWTGKNPSLKRQCGPRLAVFFTRIDPFTPEQAQHLESYICTIPRNPNRYLNTEEMTDTQKRGKAMFFRTRTNEGKEIPLKDRCDTCHPGPYFTNRKPAEVGTQFPMDTHGRFDVPHLNNIYETAPYLHDGSANTLEEIWTLFNPDDRHGVTNDMTKDQLNDLIEYLKIL